MKCFIVLKFDLLLGLALKVCKILYLLYDTCLNIFFIVLLIENGENSF